MTFHKKTGNITEIIVLFPCVYLRFRTECTHPCLDFSLQNRRLNHGPRTVKKGYWFSRPQPGCHPKLSRQAGDGKTDNLFLQCARYFFQHWHRYRLTMNQSEVEEHRLESGDRFLLITIKVIAFCLSSTYHEPIRGGGAQARVWGQVLTHYH